MYHYETELQEREEQLQEFTQALRPDGPISLSQEEGVWNNEDPGGPWESPCFANSQFLDSFKET